MLLFETMSETSQAIFQGISQLLTQRRTAEARAELERLLALDPEDPEARSQAGDVYAYTGAHSTAYKHYNQAAETYNRLGRADMALAVHHKILELDPGALDTATQTRLRLLGLLVAAEDAIVAGQYDKAAAGYHEAIRHFPNHTISYQRLASLLVRLNRVDEAADQYLIVARAFYAHGVRLKARPYFERVLELKPAQEEALTALLACLKAENKEPEGARFIKAAVQTLLQAGASERAEALFKQLEIQDPESASPLAAAVLLQAGELGHAERMAADLDLANVDVRSLFRGLGRSALERGDSVSADAYFRWAQGQSERASEQPSPVEAPGPVPQEDRAVLRTMGEVCLAEGMFEEARQIFERLVQAQPDYAPYGELLSRALGGLGLATLAQVQTAVPEFAAPPLSSPPALPQAAAARPDLARPAAAVPAPMVVPIPVPAHIVVPTPSPAPVLAPAPIPLPVPLPVPVPPVPSFVPAPPLPLVLADFAKVRTQEAPTAAPQPFVPAALPSRILQRKPVAAVLRSAVAIASIVRTAYVVQLGELPPAMASAVDGSNELIE